MCFKDDGRVGWWQRVGRIAVAMRPILFAARTINRRQMSVINLTAPSDIVHYWRSKSAAARLAHMEYLRLINYGPTAISGRLKKVFEVAQFAPG
jgi:hypothetical protein